MLGGLSNLSNMAKIVKEAGRLKEQIEQLQNDLAERTVEASSGGGMVTVKVNGRQEVMSVEIDDEIVGHADREMIQDLVAAACNAALERSREMAREEMAKLTGGLGIDLPGIM